LKSLHLKISNFKSETRLFKLTSSLLTLGILDEVHAHGFKIAKNDTPYELYADGIHFHRSNLGLSTQRNHLVGFISKLRVAWSLVGYAANSFRICRKYGIDALAVHNVFLLPLGAFLALVFGARFIYLPHELETERSGLTVISKPLTKLIEWMFIRFVKSIVVVCPPIADWYLEKYPKADVHVLRNVPSRRYFQSQKSDYLRTLYNVPDTQPIFVYQGVIDEYRGINELLQVFSSLPEKHIVFLGYGNMVPDVKRFALQFPNINFHDAVSQEKILTVCSSADFGIFFLTTDWSLSYRYALANKFFDYASAGLPIVMSSHFEYMSSLVSEHGLGWVVSPDEDALRQLLITISLDNIQQFQTRLATFSETVAWENEHQILSTVFRNYEIRV
jgi:glycosyltransferase involved in cell wall biosynthesis